MNTTQKATMYQQIERHGNNLNTIFNTGIEPVKLCKALRRLEFKAHKIATDWCNGDIEGDVADNEAGKILKSVAKILGTKYPVKFNGDARGYTLKISDKVVRENKLNIYTDMGGYGIISPDFTPNR